jgi:cation:H+ antiporter
MMMLLWIALIIVACIWIAKACDIFEPASDYLGRNLGPGIKGATINAIGSSLPELFTAFIFLFWFNDKAGFSSGVATTAGSAVFNAVIIPGLVIFTTLIANRIKGIEVDKKVIMRDGFFFILAEVSLIYCLSQQILTATMGFALMCLYGLYAGYLIIQQRGHTAEENEDEEYEFDSNSKAWKSLAWATAQIGVACYLLTESVVQLSNLWGVNTFFVAVIIAAAATSVPDTIISIKDAKKGNYEDAVSNAVGSNIFDICIGLGLPLFLYTLINGPFDLNLGVEVGVAELRVLLIIISIAVLVLFLIPKKLGYVVASILMSMYIFYAVYTIGRGTGADFVKPIANVLNSVL